MKFTPSNVIMNNLWMINLLVIRYTQSTKLILSEQGIKFFEYQCIRASATTSF